ncbi:mechanosensitive ion channel family protein [Flavobacterium agrisoli]|uniref:Mechanosensitive ion channel family protein n=1 Tax=Flavobacterium agrisoli TaxID=2793066 RepID=A0A934UL25_9FLAO|nr:mechanosensitive ion channel family protein [Flavobacterium agrisoli]MBK0371114.1 mechanosensitive ion channel family protein [Flavobacterium agrisoli]
MPLFFRLISFLFLFTTCYSSAQQLNLSKTQTNTDTATNETPPDSLGRRTPNGTVKGFIEAMAEQNYTRASQYLDLNKRAYRKEKERLRIVKSFERLLDNNGYIFPMSLISNKETGRAEDDLEPGTDLVGTLTINKETVNLYVSNQSANEAPPLWLFNAETVNSIAQINTDDVTFLEKTLPNNLKEKKLGGVPIGHWLAVLIIVLIAFLIAMSCTFLIGYSVVFFSKAKHKARVQAVVDAFSLPLQLYLAVWIFVYISQQVGISIIVRQRFSYITITIGIVALLILLWRLIDVLGTLSKKRMTLQSRASALSAILFLQRASKVAIVTLGIIAILGVLGFDLTGWIAALGIGGLALALGAQKTVENFVGSVTLIADQPVRIGDFCQIGEVKGTVESIGMRSTILRTAQRTIITIPNGILAASQIENFAYRDHFLFNPAFTFRMETTSAQLQFLLVELRALLYAHPKVNPNPANVRFTGITADAYKVDVTAYVEAPNYDEFQEIREDLLLRMMAIIEESGTGLAYPSQTLYISKDEKPLKEKAEKISTLVEDWQEKNEVQLPKFDSKRIDSLKGSIPYPPKGSSQSKS